MDNTAIKLDNTENIINLKVINGKLAEKQKVRYNLDGSIDKRHSNAVEGVSNEVYPLTEEEVMKIVDILDEKIKSASTKSKKKIAMRNKLMAIVGLNSGLRASDIRILTWSFFFDENGEFRKFYSIEPFKTRKYKKFVKIFFNDAIKKSVEEYVGEYPIKDFDDYVFASQKGGNPIEVHTVWDVIKSAAREAGINKNIGSHSLRKTWGFTVWHNADDKSKALVILQQCFNHSSTLVTQRYIGILDTELSKAYNSVNLGYCFA